MKSVILETKVQSDFINMLITSPLNQKTTWPNGVAGSHSDDGGSKTD